jgi:hypothetical protein
MSRETLACKSLTKRDLDDRIGQVVEELFAAEHASLDETQAWAPVSIDAAEFVRRMQRYVVYN